MGTPTGRNIAPAGSEYAETVCCNHSNGERFECSKLVPSQVEVARSLQSARRWAPWNRRIGEENCLGAPAIFSDSTAFKNSKPRQLIHRNAFLTKHIGFALAISSPESGLAIHQNDHQARRKFVEWAQNEIAVVPDFHKRILLSDEAHFWLNGYVNKQNCRIWSEANPHVYVETPLHPEKLTVWCALWAGGILLQKR
ncbi:transposable element Tc3 transposase [Trichonephila clavipes]|nr:transposable element Tc3 transposase [Trichonephila clavipes]